MRQGRLDALLPPETAPEQASVATSGQPRLRPTPWSVDVFLPAFVNSNPQTLPGGRQTAPEVHPEFRIGWSGRTEAVLPLRWQAVAAAATDRYGRSSLANAETLLARGRVQYESGRDDQEWQPFLSAQPARDFTLGFRTRLQTRHDFALGFSRQWNFAPGMRRVAAVNNSSDATWLSFSVNASAQRRLAAPDPSSWALSVNPGIEWTVTPRFSVSLEAEVTRRFFDRQEGGTRRDWLVAPVLTLEYLPPEGTLPAGLGSPALNFQVFFSRQTSSQQALGFTQYGAGPVLRTNWRF